MSVQSEITRIQTARNTLRTKAVSLGVGLSTDNLTQLATKFDAIVDRGTPNAEVQEGESYSIQPGYYHGGSVAGVAGGGNYSLQSKTVIPTKSEQVVNEDSGYYGLDSVTVEPIPDIYQDVSSVTATAGDVLATKVFVASNGTTTTGTMPNRGAVSATLTSSTSAYFIPAGYHNGSGSVNVVVELPKTVTPSTSTQTVSPAAGKILSTVTVNPIPDNYGDATNKTATASDILAGKTAIGWDSTNQEAVTLTGTIQTKTSSDLTVSGATVTAPAGYYASAATKTIASGVAAPPSGINYSEEVEAGVSAISGNFFLNAANVLVTPVVTPGYISSGTEDAVDITLEAPDVDVLGATTYTPTTTNQTIPSGTYINGTQTISGDANLVAGNIASGVTIFGVTGTHQGGTDVSDTTATASDVLATKYFYTAAGVKTQGSIANNGAISGTITGLGSVVGDTSYTIPAGYTSGGTVSLTSDIETALSAI